MTRSNVVTIRSQKNKMLESIGNPKFTTLSLAIFSVLLFLLRVSRENLGAVCLRPSEVVAHFQIYRIYTAPFFHGGFLHILFNIIAWMIIVRDYERTVGSFSALYAILVLLTPFMAIFHCSVAYLIDAIVGTKLRYECSVGLSGLLFAMLVANIQLSGESSVSVFGLFDMPARWYPWALALVLQLLSPNLSLLGHLSGIVMGYVLTSGYLRRLTPSDSKMEEIENNFGLIRLPQWQPVPPSGISMFLRRLLPQVNQTEGGSVWERMRGGFSNMSSWFSRSRGNDESQAFAGAGQGRTLGGEEPSVPAGRVPPTSRLLREADEAKQAKLRAVQEQKLREEQQLEEEEQHQMQEQGQQEEGEQTIEQDKPTENGITEGDAVRQ